MRSGRLRHWISIYSVYKSPGVAGAETLTLFATVPCDITWQSGKEIQALGGTFAQQTGKLTMRYIHGVRPDMVAVFNGRRFKFVSPPINMGERNRELQIVITESS